MSFINTHRFGRFWPVSWAITHRFRVPKRFPWLLNPNARLCAGHQQSSFLLILARFIGSWSPFWWPGPISTIDEPRGAFTCRSSALAVLAMLAHFMDYYSQFSGPGAIYMVAKPEGVLTCRSSTFAVLADSSPFHGLLLTILGSRSDFHQSRSPWWFYMKVLNTCGFGRFWPFSCTNTHNFGILERFPLLTNDMARLRVVHQHSSFWPILAHFMGYYSPF